MVALYEGLAALSQQDYISAKTIFRLLGEAGDSRGWYHLGRMYSFGQGAEADPGEAGILYRRAAEAGCIAAALSLGALYAQGKGVGQNFSESLKWYQKAASAGDPEAAFRLGTMYANGQGTEIDLAQAALYFEIAARKGHVQAKRYLGHIHVDMMNTASDPNSHLCTAADWYIRAALAGDAEAVSEIWRQYERLLGLADAGLPAAQFTLGWIWEQGFGKTIDLAKAIRYYQAAAKQKHPGALHHLGNLYRDEQGAVLLGKSSSQTENAMIECYRQAAELGDADSQHNLGFAYAAGIGVETNLDVSITWFRKAAEQGRAASQTDLAMQLFQRAEHGDEEEGMRWLLQAATSGYAKAMMVAADMYREGDIVGCDPVQAARWLMTALYKGHMDALHELHQLAGSMTADQLKAAEMVAEGDGSWSDVAIAQSGRRS